MVETIYMNTKDFPSEEKYGLVSQMLISAVSVPANIAEGISDRIKSQFSNIPTTAIGYLSELDTRVNLSFQLRFIKEEATFNKLSELIVRTKSLVYGFRKSLK